MGTPEQLIEGSGEDGKKEVGFGTLVIDKMESLGVDLITLSRQSRIRESKLHDHIWLGFGLRREVVEQIIDSLDAISEKEEVDFTHEEQVEMLESSGYSLARGKVLAIKNGEGMNLREQRKKKEVDAAWKNMDPSERAEFKKHTDNFIDQLVSKIMESD